MLKRKYIPAAAFLLPPALTAGVISAMVNLGPEDAGSRTIFALLRRAPQVLFFWLATASFVTIACRIRFSWRTLVLFTLLLASGMWLAPNWTAWVETLRIPDADMIRLSPDGSLIAAAEGTALRLHDSFTGALRRRLGGHHVKVWGFNFSPDGALIATGDLAGNVRIWDAKTGGLIRRFAPLGGAAWPIEFSSNARLLLVHERRGISPATETEEVHVWDIQRGERTFSKSGGVASKFLPGGRRVLTWSKRWEIWNIESGERELTFEGKGRPLGFSDDGSEIWFGSGFTIRRIDGRTGSPVGRAIALGKPFKGLRIGGPGVEALSPDRSRCFAYSRDHVAGGRIHDCATGRLLSAFFCSEPGFPQFSPEGDRLVLDEWSGGSGLEHDIHVYTRRRPEAWWGLAWLPEFWATVLFAAALGWSILRDRRTLMSPRHT